MEQWSGGMVEWWSGGMVEWWSGGLMEWRDAVPSVLIGVMK